MAKYSVDISTDVYCSSSGHYFGTVIIKGKGKRDSRDVDLYDMRLIHKDKPFTYTGYPKYVLRMIAQQFKDHWDNGRIKVYEYTRDETRRYEDLRYHDAHILQRLINQHYSEWCMG